MAIQKKTNTTKKTATTRMSADRLEGIKASKVRAGKATGTTGERLKQNAGVKDKTVRLGKGGKFYNVYDVKTGTWKRGEAVGAKKTTKPTAKPTTQMPQNIPFGGTKKPSGKEVGPGVLGVRAPKDGALRRFGPPNDQSIYRYDAKSGKFIYVSKHTPKK